MNTIPWTHVHDFIREFPSSHTLSDAPSPPSE
jgi:hypothetical protein